MSRRHLNDHENLIHLKEFEYAKINGTWCVCLPGPCYGNLSKHEVIEHEDGTISVSPSILVTMPVKEGGKIVEKELWHGYLTKGEFREC